MIFLNEVEKKQLFKYLNEPWQEKVLSFYKYEHDIGSEDGRIQGTTGFSARSILYNEWNKETLNKSSEIAMDTLKKLNDRI